MEGCLHFGIVGQCGVYHRVLFSHENIFIKVAE